MHLLNIWFFCENWCVSWHFTIVSSSCIEIDFLQMNLFFIRVLPLCGCYHNIIIVIIIIIIVTVIINIVKIDSMLNFMPTSFPSANRSTKKKIHFLIKIEEKCSYSYLSISLSIFRQLIIHNHFSYCFDSRTAYKQTCQHYLLDVCAQHDIFCWNEIHTPKINMYRIFEKRITKVLTSDSIIDSQQALILILILIPLDYRFCKFKAWFNNLWFRMTFGIIKMKYSLRCVGRRLWNKFVVFQGSVEICVIRNKIVKWMWIIYVLDAQHTAHAHTYSTPLCIHINENRNCFLGSKYSIIQ